MKASVKFRDERTPLFRAKVPLRILGFPFSSAVSAGDTKELRLDLSTAFDSGPSLRLSYRPNDPSNPFSLAVTTGVGPLGSPSGAPMSISAEFGLIGGGGRSPAFLLQLKPRIGDFSIRRSSRSPIEPPPPVPAAKIVDGEELTEISNGFSPENSSAAAAAAAAGGSMDRLFSGVEVCTRSVLPIWDRAAVKFRWGVRLPSEVKDPTAQISFQRVPLLIARKISIAHVATSPKERAKVPPADVAASDADTCISLRRQMESLQEESGVLKKALEEVRAEVLAAKAGPGGSENKKRREENSNGGKPLGGMKFKAVESGGKSAAAEEELKKALTGVAAAGA
ncbi:hypothetical protein QJS04_geneDACA016295 [Acorus gramineus]|uniref:Uncharacterized protein n=1 Tax=Acorus gramineus TaxID=55184 RepID=A0AAV9AQB3_ACOGR|nr:hypothetical protein QJS04_geneDACA016295 [Acorus gramineus]